jgi:enediyne biosynthesis protein E4
MFPMTFNENDYLYISTKGMDPLKKFWKRRLPIQAAFLWEVTLADFNNDGWIDVMTLDMLPEDEISAKDVCWVRIAMKFSS